MNTTIIDIGRDFSRFPAGRFTEDGPFSGQRFRDEFLLPKLRRTCSLVVLLDDAAGYGSSFLEEAFGGLVRAGITYEDIKNCLVLKSDDKGLLEEIWSYIDDEASRRGNT